MQNDYLLLSASVQEAFSEPRACSPINVQRDLAQADTDVMSLKCDNISLQKVDLRTEDAQDQNNRERPIIKIHHLFDISARKFIITDKTFHVVSLGVPPVLFDACQQGLKPADGTLTMSVQEGDNLTPGGCCAPQPSSDQARTLLHPQDPYWHLQSPCVVLQLRLQEI